MKRNVEMKKLGSLVRQQLNSIT